MTELNLLKNKNQCEHRKFDAPVKLVDCPPFGSIKRVMWKGYKGYFISENMLVLTFS